MLRPKKSSWSARSGHILQKYFLTLIDRLYFQSKLYSLLLIKSGWEVKFVYHSQEIFIQLDKKTNKRQWFQSKLLHED